MKRIIFAICIAVLAAACSSDDASNEPNTPSEGGGGTGGAGGMEAAMAVWPLVGVDSALPPDDLAPLDNLIQNAAVIGIGESVHTTGGELRMRARLIRYLVEQHGVRTIALENEWDRTEQVIAPFVHDCTGTAEQAAMGFNPIWWDVSTPALLQWLCDYNTAHSSDPVRVVGFDIRQAWDDYPAVSSFLQSESPDEATPLNAELASCLGASHTSMIEFFEDPEVRGYFSGTPTPEADHQACMAGADATLTLLGERRAALIASTDERTFERVRLRVVGMRAFDLSIYHLSRGSLELANPPRDAAMADVYLTFRRLDQQAAEEGALGKDILFAHNGHILRRSDEVVAGQWVGGKNLGTLVHEAIGDDYFALGQLSETTHIDWQSGPQTLTHTSDDDLEHVLGLLGHEHALVSTATAFSVEPALWSQGTAYDAGFDKLIPELHYDALVFHRTSPANDYFTPPPF